MADDDREMVLVCLTTDRFPGDPTSTRGHYCMKCADEVWMSAKMRAFWAEHPQATVVCGECSIDMAEDDDDFEIQPLPGDDVGKAILEQMPDIVKRAYGRGPT